MSYIEFVRDGIKGRKTTLKLILNVKVRSVQSRKLNITNLSILIQH